MIGRSLLLLAVLVLTGCAATPEKAQFRLGLTPGVDANNLLWPAGTAGEIPRYVFLGELTGENNFIKESSKSDKAKSAIARFLDIVIGEAPPMIMDRPQMGATDEAGRIYVTDMGRGSVFVFDGQAGVLSTWEKATGAASFISPVGIALGPEGRVYVADPELALVAQLDHEGHPLAPIGQGQLQRPTGIAYDASDGRLYVSDTGAHDVKIFDMAGNLLSTLGTRGEGPGEFNYPTHLAVRQEHLYVTDSMNARVQVFSTLTGHYLGPISRRGIRFGELVIPKGVAVDSEQNIYVVESYHDQLLIYNRRGEFLLPIGGVGEGPGNFHLPAGIWIDSRDRVYVADMLNSRVQVFQFLGGDEDDENR
ncbi:MAG TPA: 6-bladed beta-propeller [Rhodocyclaceae bacterium]